MRKETDVYHYRPPSDYARDLMMTALDAGSHTPTAKARADLHLHNAALLAEYLDTLHEPARTRCRHTIRELRTRAADLHEAMQDHTRDSRL